MGSGPASGVAGDMASPALLICYFLSPPLPCEDALAFDGSGLVLSAILSIKLSSFLSDCCTLLCWNMLFPLKGNLFLARLRFQKLGEYILALV